MGCQHTHTHTLFVYFYVVCCVAQALIEEFQPELAKKEGKLDSDPHLWMPVRVVYLVAVP